MKALIILVFVLSGVAFLVKFSKELMDAVGIATYGLVRLSKVHRSTLEQWSPYYRALDSTRQRLFERRVKELLYEKEWLGKGIAVTMEMQIRIAATMAQVTLGFDDLLLLHFKKVFILPGEFVNPRTGQRQVGEVITGRGAIVLSWASFQEGYSNPGDARNVGLHEVAHALWIDNGIDDGEYHFLQADLLQRWQELAHVEMDRINSGEDRFLRRYAATNQAEFFAVAMEYFFEQPLELKTTLPELYGCMKGLLKQDPEALLPAAQ